MYQKHINASSPSRFTMLGFNLKARQAYYNELCNLDAKLLTLQGASICRELINDKKQNTEKYQPQYPNEKNISREIFEKTNMKSSLPGQKALKKVKRIRMLETIVKVLQVCLNVHI